MIETYDAQMIEYPSDVDVQMHSSGDAWFNEEAVMEDDGHVSHSDKLMSFDQQNTVEVEMEPFQEEPHVEFDMADDIVEQNTTTAELLDVEVYDASLLPSPVVHDADTFGPLGGEVAETSHHPEAYEITPSLHREPASSEHSTHDQVVSESSGETTNEAPQPQSESHSQLSDPTGSEATEAVLSTLSPQPEVAGHDEHGVYTRSTNPDIIELHQHTDRPSGAPDSTNSVQETGDSRDEIAVHPAQELFLLTDSAEHEHAEFPEENPAEEVATDPHEICEGVYIEPPPPVFLSLLGAEHPNITLFNQPSPRSGNTSPTDETQPVLLQPLTLMLHHQPTLYYEPLSAVFEALRQEELISSKPDLVEGELVLDAHDLRLVVSEDNLYAREVTLHDLNIIHDGSNIAGPLRLRLRTVVPRFIVRYHSLQAQINRLNVSAEDEQKAEEHYHEQVHYQDATPHHQGPEQSEAQDQEQLAAEIQEEPDDTVEDQAPASTDGQQDEQTGEPPTAPSEQSEHQEVPDELEESVGRTADEQADNLVPTLEGEAAHNADDTDTTAVYDAYAEYTEYTEGNEEYEEEYPALPDEDEEENELTHESGPADDAATQAPYGSADRPHEYGERPANGVRDQAEPSELTTEGTTELAEFAGDDEDSTEQAADTIAGEELEYQSEEIGSVQEHSYSKVQLVDESHLPLPLTSSEIEKTGPKLELINEESVSAAAEQANEEQYDFVDGEWDDNLDGEGESDPGWEEHDTTSNESSVTLSSKTSTKRSYEQLEPDEVEEESPLPASPGSKRARVQ